MLADINVSTCTCADEMDTKHGGAGSTQGLGRDRNFSRNVEILAHLKDMFTFFKLESRLPDMGNNGEHDVHGQFMHRAVHREFCLAANINFGLMIVVK